MVMPRRRFRVDENRWRMIKRERVLPLDQKLKIWAKYGNEDGGWKTKLGCSFYYFWILNGNFFLFVSSCFVFKSFFPFIIPFLSILFPLPILILLLSSIFIIPSLFCIFLFYITSFLSIFIFSLSPLYFSFFIFLSSPVPLIL